MYAAWQALQPVWFTDAAKAQIPDAFIPTEALRRENARARQAVGRLRSLSSVVGVPSPQPIGGEEYGGAAQPNPQPGRAEQPDGS
jgi:hypothetical protein